jgi:hypothetical protein
MGLERLHQDGTENDINEETSMTRLVGSVLGLFLVLAVGQPVRAQMPAPVYGGFGLEYTQPVPTNRYVLDRWWMVQATPTVAAPLPAPAVVQQPVVVEPAQTGRLSRAARPSRSLGRPVSSAVVQSPTALPTGSLNWLAAPGMSLYSPAQRYASYGQGYGVSPYGTADYGAAYKGMSWGY